MDSSTLEKRRLTALERLGILDTPPEDRFERLTRIARQYYGVKTALFSVLDANRQWFKSRQGLDVSETPRPVAFCDYAIQQDKAFIVCDATKDPRFSQNPLVTGHPNIRFYAGMPVREPTGFKIGTICIIDDQPRDFGELDLDILRNLATMIEDELERTYLSIENHEFVEVSHLNRSIQRALNVFLTSDNQNAAFEQMLNDLLSLTGSQFGFIGETLSKENGAPYLKIGAITNIAWNPKTQALYQQIERRGLVFDRLDTLIALPMTSGEVVISSDVATDPRRGGLPQGHPDIDAYIGIPVFSGDQQVGLVGLANRLGGYKVKLAEELEPLLQTLGNLIERKRLHHEKQQHQKRLEKAANYDALTDLPNRRKLTEIFTQELHEANLREGTVALCFIDLDGFKGINDQHGHAVGDAVLKIISERLKATVRQHDAIGRLGGDEFVAILRDVEDSTVYNRILEVVRRPISYQNSVMKLSASMGVTVYPDDAEDPDTLLRHADQAMYAAKDAGKDSYSLFDLASHYSRKERVRVLEQVDEALAKKQFELYYQPKINYRIGSVEGFEALIRWNHPEEGLLSPARFLEHLEFTEYARQVGLFVMESAVGVICEFMNLGLPYTVSINLSPSHFLSEHFPDDITGTMNECPHEVRDRLIIEILETTALDDTTTVMKNLSVCRNAGLGISLDDFGTGYSSLNYFRTLPAQEVKIDRTFVGDLIGNQDNSMIVEAILRLSQSFQRRTVAEGVETAEQEERLLSLGCDVGQGYLYSPPLPLAEALEWANTFTWARYRSGQN